MSVSYDNGKLLQNIKRQSLVLEKRLNIPKYQAHMMLAHCFYNELSIADVRKKIEVNDYSGRIFIAAVGPNAGQDLLDKMLDVFAEVVISVSTNLENQSVEVNVPDLILEVFALTSEDLKK